MCLEAKRVPRSRRQAGEYNCKQSKKTSRRARSVGRDVSGRGEQGVIEGAIIGFRKTRLRAAGAAKKRTRTRQGLGSGAAEKAARVVEGFVFFGQTCVRRRAVGRDRRRLAAEAHARDWGLQTAAAFFFWGGSGGG